jgi:prophage tail gpP-like protein
MNLKIDDRKNNVDIEFFNDISLTLQYDAVASAFSFSFYFNPENEAHKVFAAVGRYQLVRLYHNGELLITGFIISQSFSSSAQGQLVHFSGYSVPGVLEDCQIPPSAYPLQSDGLSLKQIVDKLLLPFQIKSEVDSSVASLMDKVYDKTTASESESVKDYITSLATQRNIVVTNTPTGRLFFTKAKTEVEEIIHFEKGVIGTNYTMTFNGQTMHSQITVIKQASTDGGDAAQYTIKNPYVPESTTAFRPKVIVQNSGDDIDTKEVAESELASELKGISLKITTDRWEVGGKVIKPNNIITITDPELFLYKKTRFFIQSVEFTGNSTVETAVLTCVLPEVYSGNVPTENIFAQ